MAKSILGTSSCSCDRRLQTRLAFALQLVDDLWLHLARSRRLLRRPSSAPVRPIGPLSTLFSLARSSFGVASACFLVPILLAAVLRLASAHPHCHLQNGAYVTLASGADHIRQAAVLGYSLRRARTEYKMVVLVTEQLGVTEKSLLRLFYDEIVVVDKFPFEGALSNSTNSAAFLSKFRALQLVQYTRIVYLGADTITLKNIDELFCCTPPCGVYDMALWETTVYGTTINGDVLVLEPSEEAFERVLNVVLNVDPFAFEFADVPPCFFRMLQHCKQGYGSKTYIGPIGACMALLCRCINTPLTSHDGCIQTRRSSTLCMQPTSPSCRPSTTSCRMS